MSVIAFLLALASFGSFGFASEGQHHAIVGRRPSAATKLRGRCAAWLALAASAIAAIVARGWAFGTVWWFGCIMLAAGVAFLGLNLVAGRSAKAAIVR